jgi:hypothetical protein
MASLLKAAITFVGIEELKGLKLMLLYMFYAYVLILFIASGLFFFNFFFDK